MSAIKSGESTGTTEITPSGLEVYYQSHPKRLYRVNGVEVPSVTTVLDVLNKPALPWWGMKVGADGVLELIDRDLLPSSEERPSIDDIVALLTEHKLTVNHVRDKAGDRGQAVHDALETWAQTGQIPDYDIYPEQEREYIRGLRTFLLALSSAEPVASEVLVASSEYGYAGRYDLRLRTSEPHEVIVKRTKRKNDARVLQPGEYLVDLKTSKGIYPSHARQLEAYEQASIESGYVPTEGRGILHVSAEGTYEFVRSWATFADFKCVLDVWQSDQEMKERQRAQAPQKA